MNTEKLQKRLWHQFNNHPEVLERALTDKSYSTVDKKCKTNTSMVNTGSLLIQLTVSIELERRGLGEKSTDISTQAVSDSVILAYGKELNILRFVRHNVGKEPCSKRALQKVSINATKAVFAAVLLDCDRDVSIAQSVILPFFEPFIKSELKSPSRNTDAKTMLQEVCQHRYGKTPVYEVINQDGAQNDIVFTIGVFLNGDKLAEGEGSSKKVASQAAATEALRTKIPADT